MRVQLFGSIHRSSESCYGLVLASGGAGMDSQTRVGVTVSLVNGEVATFKCHRSDKRSTSGHIAAVTLSYGSRKYQRFV
jgi:hypothetical protein